MSTSGTPPFTGNDPLKTYNIILKGIDAASFPSNLFPTGKGAKDLIKRFCKDNPAERLGYQKGGIKDIMKHKYRHNFYKILYSIALSYNVHQFKYLSVANGFVR